MPPAVSAQRPLLWVLAATASFCCVALATRAIGNNLATTQVLFFRALIGALVLAPIVWRLRPRLHKALFTLHLARNSLHLLGQYGWFFGLIWLPLADVTAIEFSTPLWVALLGWACLGERPSRPTLLAIALGLAGVLTISMESLNQYSSASLWLLASALGYAGAHLCTRSLATAGHSALAILVWMYLLQTPVTLALCLNHWQWPAAGLWLYLLPIGLCALSAHYCLTRALALADTAKVIAFDYLRLPILGGVGLLAFNEPLTGALLAGSCCILAGCWINMRGATPAAPLLRKPEQRAL
ncbi:DMT family transporter [Simiduia sp. 21SJ11W-1]|uniref:DMT family transporter n=1 Tax=Simiduia sp. 21SJ11W-1 TaxID=2909669 RepID=UPI00209DBAAA|nr:DMT family transporter [Simiduia sp. 21SJ11W-1]UTA46889.1 DMT family transporter [Simiduia sp. 21SJ11W-1]